jgi:transcriptional regulator with XRE-family HTH domain
MKTLRELLRERNISQSIVSDALGINVNNLRRYDDLRRRSLEEILKISKATGIDISELIGTTFNTTISKASGTINTGSIGGHNLNIADPPANQLELENAELKGQIRYMKEEIREKDSQILKLELENAQLRKLLEDNRIGLDSVGRGAKRDKANKKKEKEKGKS